MGSPSSSSSVSRANGKRRKLRFFLPPPFLFAPSEIPPEASKEKLLWSKSPKAFYLPQTCASYQFPYRKFETDCRGRIGHSGSISQGKVCSARTVGVHTQLGCRLYFLSHTKCQTLRYMSVVYLRIAIPPRRPSEISLFLLFMLPSLFSTVPPFYSKSASAHRIHLFLLLLLLLVVIPVSPIPIGLPSSHR